MKKEMPCGCEQGLSRRRVLQSGLVAMAAVALGDPQDSLAESRVKSNAATKQALRAAGARSIDIHAHYYPKQLFDVVVEGGKSYGAEYEETADGFTLKTPAGNQISQPRKFTDLKLRLADMDAQGIAVQAISLGPPMVYWGSADFSHKLAKAWNDAASSAHTAYPNRLVALISLPMLSPDHAIDELNRASKLPGVRGVYLGAHIGTRELDDPLFEPIYARIEALNLPIFLHPLQGYGAERLQDYYLSNLLGNPYDTGIAASRLIFGGVLDRYPNLQVSLPHGGGTFPILVGRLDHGAQVRPEITRLKLPKPPSAYLQRFTYDTIVHSKPIMEFLVQEVGAERIMIGSDYCFDMGYERPVQFLDQIKLSSAQRRLIMGDNAARVLKL